MSQLQKYNNLLTELRRHNKLSVAFSGGIDSTFLLSCAVKALGEENVTAIHLVSPLASKSSAENLRKTILLNFSKSFQLLEVEVNPFSWEGFAENSPRRCYICKKQMYNVILDKIKRSGLGRLADGTNWDDLATDRPGLQAVEELEVLTPLAKVQLTKLEIRSLARLNGLTNYNLPSNSCLATRIRTGQMIDKASLQLIEEAELRLAALGFEGNRVRLIGNRAIVEVMVADVERVMVEDTIRTIQKMLRDIGITEMTISQEGRQ